MFCCTLGPSITFATLVRGEGGRVLCHFTESATCRYRIGQMRCSIYIHKFPCHNCPQTTNRRWSMGRWDGLNLMHFPMDDHSDVLPYRNYKPLALENLSGGALCHCALWLRMHLWISYSNLVLHIRFSAEPWLQKEIDLGQYMNELKGNALQWSPELFQF